MEKMLEFWERAVDNFKDYVIFPLQNIGIVDIIDILLLSCLLYMIFKFIRERHVGRIALGLGAVVFIYVIGDLLHMTAISSILKNFYVVGIMVICIIFQPELRAALEEVGSTSIQFNKRIKKKKTNTDAETLSMVEEINAAAFELSSKGEGALIVIQRGSPLYSQMTEGVPVDAKVTRQLLCNIFVNKSPLHDGAVIIRDKRIAVASSKSKNISESDDIEMRRLGTRHRAALRISEVSDAVVVVVSEETGNISIANNKILQRDYQDIGKDGKHKSNDLRDDLYKLLTGNSVNDEKEPTLNIDAFKTSSYDEKNTQKEETNSNEAG